LSESSFFKDLQRPPGAFVLFLAFELTAALAPVSFSRLADDLPDARPAALFLSRLSPLAGDGSISENIGMIT